MPERQVADCIDTSGYCHASKIVAIAGYLHAETDALLPLIRNNVDLSKASIYIYRRMKNGGVGMARPCPRCMSIIKQAKIRDINYTTDDGFANEYIVDNKEF